jgi:hypothetical protein
MTDDKTKVSGEAVNDPEELREQIEEDREQLGDTVEALAQKADVKAQAQEKAAEVTEQVKQRPVPVGAVVGGVLAALILLRWLRRR